MTESSRKGLSSSRKANKRSQTFSAVSTPNATPTGGPSSASINPSVSQGLPIPSQGTLDDALQDRLKIVQAALDQWTKSNPPPTNPIEALYQLKSILEIGQLSAEDHALAMAYVDNFENALIGVTAALTTPLPPDASQAAFAALAASAKSAMEIVPALVAEGLARAVYSQTMSSHGRSATGGAPAPPSS